MSDIYIPCRRDPIFMPEPHECNICLVDKKIITENGTYNASSDNLTGYSEVIVDVHESFAPEDEGKVVDNGALVSQTAQTYTENGIYDTTLINSITINVQGGVPLGIAISSHTFADLGLSWENSAEEEA